jgi:hypothetical protein
LLANRHGRHHPFRQHVTEKDIEQEPMLWSFRYFLRTKWRFWLKTKQNYAKIWS